MQQCMQWIWKTKRMVGEEEAETASRYIEDENMARIIDW